MIWKYTLIFFAFFHFANTVLAQQYVSGKVYSVDTKDELSRATISNISTNKKALTDFHGSFKITAKAGDWLTISYIGYWTDTIRVTNTILINGLEIKLRGQPEELQRVIVQQSYQQDSAERRNTYSKIWEHKSNITGNNTPVGFGVTVSPLTYFSKKEKQIKQQKKRLEYQEELFYIDYKFSKERITRITGLKGDSLTMFRNMNRPSYKFCRKASYEDMTQYIINKYTTYLKRKENVKM